MTLKLLKLPFAFVAWKDAHCVSGATEMSIHEIPHAAANYVLSGWVLRYDAEGITLASEYSSEGTYRGINFVPAGMIASVQLVKLSPVKQKVVPLPPEL